MVVAKWGVLLSGVSILQSGATTTKVSKLSFWQKNLQY